MNLHFGSGSLRLRGLLLFLAITGLFLITLFAIDAGDARSDAFGPPAPFAFRDRLFDVAFASHSVAVIVGNPGKVFRTADGGDTWSLVPIDTTEPLFGVFFLNDQIGWICGRKGLVFKTTDAGKTWVRQNSGTEEHLFDIHFVNEKIGIAVGNFGAVIRTADGGETWSFQLLEPMSSASIYSVELIDENVAYLAGEYPTWEAQLEEDVEAISLSSVFKTVDGGATWQRVAMPSTSHIFGMDFTGPDVGYVVGSKGLLNKTADGGATWSQISVNTDFHLLSVQALTGDRMVACGNAGAALVGEGAVATVVPTHAYFWLSSCVVNSDGKGIMVGDHGLVMRSSDAGRTWRNLDSSSSSKE